MVVAQRRKPRADHARRAPGRRSWSQGTKSGYRAPGNRRIGTGSREPDRRPGTRRHVRRSALRRSRSAFGRSAFGVRQVSCRPCCWPATSGARRRSSACSVPTGGRPELLDVREYVTLDYPSLSAMIGTFLAGTGVRPQEVQVACVGVAGPNIKQVARLTNVPWAIDGRELMATTGIRRAWILNDVEAMAYGVPALRADELRVLQTGEFNADGNACLMAAGTGPRPGHPGPTTRPPGAVALRRRPLRLRPARAPRDRTARVPDGAVRSRHLRARHLGQGASSTSSASRATTARRCSPRSTRTTCRPRSAVADWTGPTRTASRRCSCSCPSTAARLPTSGLQCVATGGVYLGGGIPSKILPAFDLPLLHGRLPRQASDDPPGRAHARLHRPEPPDRPARRRRVRRLALD